MNSDNCTVHPCHKGKAIICPDPECRIPLEKNEDARQHLITRFPMLLNDCLWLYYFYFCKKCKHFTIQKSNLKQHMFSVHKRNDLDLHCIGFGGRDFMLGPDGMPSSWIQPYTHIVRLYMETSLPLRYHPDRIDPFPALPTPCVTRYGDEGTPHGKYSSKSRNKTVPDISRDNIHTCKEQHMANTSTAKGLSYSYPFLPSYISSESSLSGALGPGTSYYDPSDPVTSSSSQAAYVSYTDAPRQLYDYMPQYIPSSEEPYQYYSREDGPDSVTLAQLDLTNDVSNYTDNVFSAESAYDEDRRLATRMGSFPTILHDIPPRVNVPNEDTEEMFEEYINQEIFAK